MLFHFFGKLRLGKSSNAEEQMSREAGEQEKAEEQGGRGEELTHSETISSPHLGTSAPGHLRTSAQKPPQLRTWAPLLSQNS